MPPTQTAKNAATPITSGLRQDHEAYLSYQARPQGMVPRYLSSDHVAYWKPNHLPNQSIKIREFGKAKVETAEDLEKKHPLINKPNVRFINTNEAMRVLTDYTYDGLYRSSVLTRLPTHARLERVLGQAVQTTHGWAHHQEPIIKHLPNFACNLQKHIRDIQGVFLSGSSLLTTLQRYVATIAASSLHLQLVIARLMDSQGPTSYNEMS
ncbi:hypothetical protein L7F22_056229 [Adiantum nelumboides]|nr:hypothetical protein [Adiantum nelumboides]